MWTSVEPDFKVSAAGDYCPTTVDSKRESLTKLWPYGNCASTSLISVDIYTESEAGTSEKSLSSSQDVREKKL